MKYHTARKSAFCSDSTRATKHPMEASLLGLLVILSVFALQACSGDDLGPEESARHIARIEVTPAYATIDGIGDSTQFTAVAFDDGDIAMGGVAFMWSSTNESIVTVGADGMVVGVAGGWASVEVSAEGVKGTASVEVVEVVSGLAFSVQPQSVEIGLTLRPSVEVTILDPEGDVAVSRSDRVLLEIATGPDGAVLMGTVRKSANRGVARFDDLWFDRAGDGYTLRASAGTIPGATSAPFDVLPTDEVRLFLPRNGGVVIQNDPNTGCPAHPNRGYGFALRFYWNALTPSPPGGYRIFAAHKGASFPIVNSRLYGNVFPLVSCNGFVIDRNLNEWEWYVEALDSLGKPFQRSETWTFSFAPCRLANGSPCNAPG